MAIEMYNCIYIQLATNAQKAKYGTVSVENFEG